MAILSQLPELLRYTIFSKLSAENLMMLKRVSKGDRQQIRDYQSSIWQQIETEQLRQLDNSFLFLKVDETRHFFYVPTLGQLPKTIDTLKTWEIGYLSFAEKFVGGDYDITVEQSQNFNHYLFKICYIVGHEFLESQWQRTTKFARALMNTASQDVSRWGGGGLSDSCTEAFNDALKCFSEQKIKRVANHNGQPTITVFKLLCDPNNNHNMHLLEMRVFGKKANIAQKYEDLLRVNPYIPDKILSLLPSYFDSIWQEATNIHHNDLSAIMGHFFRQLRESATKERAWSDVLKKLAKKIKGETILELTDSLVSVITTISPKENEEILPQYLNLLHYLTVKFCEIQAERRELFRNENDYQKRLEEKKLEEISENKP